MLKRLFSLMMIVMMFTVQAQAATDGGLKSAFDELNYSLSVDWDQKDKGFYTKQMEEFSQKVRELQSSGLTQSQMVDFIKSEVKDKRMAQDIETAFNVVSINKMSAEEASAYMVKTMKKSYTAGASWNGDVVLYAAMGVLVVVAVVSVALAGIPGASGNTGGYCAEVYVCSNSCYSDYYYGYSCYNDCGYVCR
jgi:hypothetical protein